jgi:hypothetical protein
MLFWLLDFYNPPIGLDHVIAAANLRSRRKLSSCFPVRRVVATISDIDRAIINALKFRLRPVLISWAQGSF